MDHLPVRPAIKKLMVGGGPLQLCLFDQQALAEISSRDFPGERLIACRNPVRPPSAPASLRLGRLRHYRRPGRGAGPDLCLTL